MIKNLEGIQETIDYDNFSFIIYLNNQAENYSKHWHRAIEIVMPYENTYDIVVGDTEFKMNEYDILIIPSGDIHSINAPALYGQRIFLQFENLILKTVRGFPSAERVFMTPWFITPGEFPDLHKKVKDILELIISEYIKKDDHYEAYIIAKITEIAVHLAREQIAGDDTQFIERGCKRKEQLDKFNACLEYINSNYDDNLTLEMVAGKVNFSKYHFTRWFKQFANMSFYSYLTHTRIQAAETMLINSETPITEIALESGFQSITTFNRVFKDTKKCTPTEFRSLYHFVRKNKDNSNNGGC